MKQTSSNGTVYSLTGRKDADVIVLIHGLGLTRDTWASHLAAYEEAHTVLNYDLYGHGESAPPPEIPNLTTFSEQLRELMDELGIEKATLVGFSLGGMINRRFAMDYPDRVSALGILNSPHERGDAAQKLVEERAAQSDAGGPGATIDATLIRWFTPSFLETRKPMLAMIKAWVMANDHTVYAQCRMVLANGVIELIRPKPAITAPSLIITCENDSGSTPAMSQSIGDEIAGSEIMIIPKLQHMGLVERPELFTKPLLHFLQSRNL
ncbi:MAG: alpha/beta fold hydrolase [Leucothrix sp.]